MILRAFAVWLFLVLLAIGNGLFREKILEPSFGSGAAQPLSGITLSLLIVAACILFLPFLRPAGSADSFVIGGFWLVLTLVFEFLFGHFVLGRPWGDILSIFHIHKGNLMILVLMTTFIGPWLAIRIRGWF